ncbi:MAG: ribosome silencing factor [Pseudoflavonifractor sp.]|nr:ribosome silencing factor [Alloprevotella sp.]MCM1116619.1 ribosome silencing factor [Pseudoflavonifractor sp.]
MTHPTDITPLIIEGIRNRKGRKITTIDMTGIETAATPRFIICEGSSSQQVGAIADSIREYLLEQVGIKPYNYDGYGNSTWIVIDYGDTMVHIFHPETRRLYNLEELWADGVVSELPDLD